jgi:hypothetical protein
LKSFFRIDFHETQTFCHHVHFAVGAVSRLNTLARDFAKAANFGDSFGAINALFSGVALALTIYSMILQQRQNAEFEQKTLAAMTQQAETIQLNLSPVFWTKNVRSLRSWSRYRHC